MPRRLAPSLPRRLVVFGGATITAAGAGRWATKRTFAEYLLECATLLGGPVAFFALNVPGQSSLQPIPSQITVVPTGTGRRLWWRTAVRLMKESRGAVVVLHLPGALPWVGLLPLLRRQALVIAVYLAEDFEANAGTRQVERTRWSAWLYRYVHHVYIRGADVVFARGRSIALDALQLNPSVVETIPMGHLDLSPGFLHPIARAKGDVPRILYVGKLQWSKGIGDLVNAFRSMVREGEGGRGGAELHLVGDGTDANDIRRLVEQQELNGRVIFHGFVNEPLELERLWRSSDLLVMCSTAPEGVPRVIDEALNRGLPVIATSLARVRAEFSNGEVLFVPPGNPEALAAAVTRILDDDQLRQSLIARGYERVRRWVADGSAARQHLRVCEETLAKATRERLV